jgi:hypothetical protein
MRERKPLKELHTMHTMENKRQLLNTRTVELIGGKEITMEELPPYVKKENDNAGVPYPGTTHQAFDTIPARPPLNTINEMTVLDPEPFTSYRVIQDKMPTIHPSNLAHAEVTEDMPAQVTPEPGPRLNKGWAPSAQWLSKHRVSFAQRLVKQLVAKRGLPNIISQSIRLAHKIPTTNLRHLKSILRGSEPTGAVTPQSIQPYSINMPDFVEMPEIAAVDAKTIDPTGNDTWTTNLGNQSNVVYPLPTLKEPIAKTVSMIHQLSVIPRMSRNPERLALHLLSSDRLTSAGNWPLLSSESISQPAPGTGQVSWSKPMQKLPIDHVYQIPIIPKHRYLKSKVGNTIPATESSDETVEPFYHDYSKSEAKGSITEESTGRSLVWGNNYEPAKDFVFTDGPHQPLSIIDPVYQIPIIPKHRYLKSKVGNTIPATESSDETVEPFYHDYSKSEAKGSMSEEGTGRSLVRGNNYKPAVSDNTDAKLSASKPLLGSQYGPKASFSIGYSESSMSPAFNGSAFYGGQPTPQLALAPINRQGEEVSSPLLEAKPKVEETTQETCPLDYNTIALVVYTKLKKRLATEKERTLGVC